MQMMNSLYKKLSKLWQNLTFLKFLGAGAPLGLAKLVRVTKKSTRINLNLPESTHITPYQPLSTLINPYQPILTRINLNQPV